MQLERWPYPIGSMYFSMRKEERVWNTGYIVGFITKYGGKVEKHVKMCIYTHISRWHIMHSELTTQVK